MDFISPDEQAFQNEYYQQDKDKLSPAEAAKLVEQALIITQNVLNRGMISWEISTPEKRSLKSPLIKRGNKLYSGDMLLCDQNNCDPYTWEFAHYIIEKNNISVIESLLCASNPLK